MSILALDEHTAATGALVYWRLEGELDPQELGVLWKRAGLDPAWLPQTPAPSTALARALRERMSRRRMLRPLDGRAGHALVQEAAEGDDLSYSVGLKVKLDAAGRPVFEPADHPLAEDIRHDYNKHLETCSAEDIGLWLCNTTRRVDALGLRDRGGFYYIPPHQVGTWDAIVSCLKGVSEHRVFKIPALTSGEAVEAILDAIATEAGAEAAKMEAELLADELGGRALTGRVSRCEAVEEKVSRYEALLGTKMDAIRARLTSLRGNLAAAALMAQDEM